MMRNNTQTGILFLMLSAAAVGCSDSVSPSAPSASQPAPPPQNPQPSGTQPIVATIAPNVGSVHGGAWATITGTGFEPGATVTLGVSNVRALVNDGRSMTIWTDAHVAETVDVVVTNRGGLASRLSGGFRFAPRESFDFNGDWVAHAGGHYETEMRFTIRNDVLVSVSCGKSVVSTLSPPSLVINGEFSFRGENGLAVSGTLVSPVNAVGTVNVPDSVLDCTAASWWADKK